MTRHIPTFAIVMALLGSGVRPATAEVIRYDFSGIIRTSFGTAPQAAGDLFTGSLVIDTDLLPATEQGTGFRRFEGPVDLRVAFQSAESGREYRNYAVSHTNLVVNNDVPYDAFRASVFDLAQLNAGRGVVFGFYFTDRHGTALSSTDLPRPLDPRAFDDWRMFYGDYYGPDWQTSGSRGQFTGLVTSLNGIDAPNGLPASPTPVPEPSTLLLSALGVAGAFLRRRRGIGRPRVDQHAHEIEFLA